METMTMIIYALLIVLIMVAIAIGIRLIVVLHKVDDLLDNVNTKVHTLDKTFEFIGAMNDKMAAVGDAVVGFVSGGIKRIFKDKKNYSEEEEDEDE